MSYTAADERYTDKHSWFRRCGRSGLMLPAVSIGCWHNFGTAGTDSGRHADEAAFHKNAQDMLFTAFDVGITHFDLANNYGPVPGAAEERVGRILKEDLAAYRDELIISTKAGYGMWPGPYGDHGSRKYLLASLDQSLRRLQLDYVDIFYHHRFDPHTPLEETLFALDSAVRSGKALYAGVSNYNGAQLADAVRICEANGYVKPIIDQPVYSMFNRAVEKELLPNSDRLGVGVIPFSPLAQGLLTNKYLNDVPDDSRAKQGQFLKESQVTPQVVGKVRKLNDLAQARGQSLAQMALSWTLRPQQGGSGVTSALIGASRASQVRDCADCVKNLAFTTDELKQIDAILAA